MLPHKTSKTPFFFFFRTLEEWRSERTGKQRLQRKEACGGYQRHMCLLWFPGDLFMFPVSNGNVVMLRLISTCSGIKMPRVFRPFTKTCTSFRDSWQKRFQTTSLYILSPGQEDRLHLVCWNHLCPLWKLLTGFPRLMVLRKGPADVRSTAFNVNHKWCCVSSPNDKL